MSISETDYLVIGAGAVGLAFVDTLFDEDPDCHITIVDRRARPGGHWVDAYPYVALHQPSTNYGVNSMELCSARVDTQGHNAGMYPLARHPEILAYYLKLMNERLLPSGRVAFHPLTDYRGEESGVHRLRGILSGDERSVRVRRRIVDATWFQTSVPATHTPSFEVAEGTRFAIPGELPALVRDPEGLPDRYVILGAGKTAMDAGVWLLEAGVAPERIGWVRPRDSWMFNRWVLQPASAEFERLLGYQRALVECAASSATGQEMFEKLEERGVMLRIDRGTAPTMFHYAVISEGEVDMLRRIEQVFRQGHVTRIAPGRMEFADETVDLPENTLFIDCTATAVPFRQRDGARPFFEPGRITPQLVQSPWVTYSAAFAAFLEANYDTDEERNALCPPTPLTGTPDTFPYAVMENLLSTARLGEDAKASAFNARSRLHPVAPTIAAMIERGDPRLAVLTELGEAIAANMPGVIALGTKARALHEAGMPTSHAAA